MCTATGKTPSAYGSAGRAIRTGSNNMIWSNRVKKDEEIIFFPTVASYDAGRRVWHADIHGWIFEPELGGDIRRLFRMATGIRKSKNENPSIFKQRSAGFLVDNERGKRISIAFGGRQFVIPRRSAANGHFYAQIALPETLVESARQDNRLTYHAVLSHHDNRRFEGEVYLLDDEGVSIVSDVDDTIKISQVREKKQLMLNTFYRPFRDIPGMADYYTLLSYLPQSSFHYISSSPWQLFKPIQAFCREKDFPPGSFHMKMFRFKDRSITSLFASPIRYKMNIIEPLMLRFPRRQFILIGDSGEKDPEIYGELARRRPRQVQKILIRNASDEQADNPRMQQAMREITKKRWQLFDQAEEIP